MIKEEVWRDIPNYEGYYQVSNLGNVRSLERVVIRRNNIKCSVKLLYKKKNILKSGYLAVTLTKEGNPKTFTVHKLVAIAFLNHTPNGYKIVIDHIDNDKLNNNADNLQLITNRKNSSKDRVGSSKYTGVCFHKGKQKWYSSIRINGNLVHLLSTNNEIKAKEMYDMALIYLSDYKNPKQFRSLLKSI